MIIRVTYESGRVMDIKDISQANWDYITSQTRITDYQIIKNVIIRMEKVESIESIKDKQ
ncbi:MAG: hypothetical protein PHG18_05045 [Bacilli bacterium]|nr:hypothetical protein [Bacilli bacterium]